MALSAHARIRPLLASCLDAWDEAYPPKTTGSAGITFPPRLGAAPRIAERGRGSLPRPFASLYDDFSFAYATGERAVRGTIVAISVATVFPIALALAAGSFDGTWKGPVTYTTRCGAGADMEWVITDNELSGQLMGAQTQKYTGTVSSDGKVRLTVSNTSNNSRTAKFEEDHFLYKFKSTGCGLGSVRLYRTD